MLLRGNNYAFARQYLWCCLVVGIWLSVLASSQSYLQPTTYNQTPTTKHQQPIILYFYLLIFYSSTIRPQVLSGRQYLAGVCSSHFYMFWYCLPDSSFLLVLNPETSSRDTWIRVLHGWLAQRGNKYGIISELFETYEKVKFWFFACFCSTNQFIIFIAKSNYKLRSPTPIPSVFNQDFKEWPMC